MKAIYSWIGIITITVICSGCSGLHSTNKAAYKTHLLRGQRYVSSNKYNKSIQEFTKALKLGKQMNKTMIPTIMLGETYVRGNEIGKARKISNEVLKKWPKESCSWELAGKVALKQNRLKEAGEYFEEALHLAKKRDDIERITSLINLTKGLQAYAQANMQSTKQHFAGIKNKALVKDIKTKSKAILGLDISKSKGGK